MANKKNLNGVQATIERLTRETPCPDHLRNSLNKFLYEPKLFEGASNKQGSKRLGKLKVGATDNLVRNLLDLDTIFRGDTTLVSKIVLKEINVEQLTEVIDAAHRDIQRRLDSYAFWAQRMESLKQILTHGRINLKTEHLLEALNLAPGVGSTTLPARFGLRAIQELERIETRGRPGKLTAKELSELAEAYLTLGDLSQASEKARMALEVDHTFARAWFIRVMVALRARNASLHEIQRQRLIETEIAEPMSGQESMARELADEEASRATRLNEKLDEILPQAILHWPKTNGRQYDHLDQRMIVRDIFISQTFLRVTLGAHRTNHTFLQQENGFGPEEKFSRRNWPPAPGIDFTYGECRLPLSELDRDALSLIFAEKDKHPHRFFELGSTEQISKDLKLIHLRWLLKLDGYAQHWLSFVDSLERYPELYLKEILGHRLMERVWQMHQCLNGGFESVISPLELWRTNSINWVESNCRSTELDQLSLLFHHQFVRHEFQNCIAIARKASGITDGVTTKTGHPTEEYTTVPTGSRLYWRYLEVICVMKLVSTGKSFPPEGVELMLSAENLALAFQTQEDCFWVETMEVAEGCIEDYECPPYDIDLRHTQPWMETIEAMLSLPDQPQALELQDTLTRLEKLERPFAPSPPNILFVDLKGLKE